jgi:hypothetical protein
MITTKNVPFKKIFASACPSQRLPLLSEEVRHFSSLPAHAKKKLVFTGMFLE